MKNHLVKVKLSRNKAVMGTEETYTIEQIVGAIQVVLTHADRRGPYVWKVGDKINTQNAQQIADTHRDYLVTVVRGDNA